jgi:hypothetical protein
METYSSMTCSGTPDQIKTDVKSSQVTKFRVGDIVNTVNLHKSDYNNKRGQILKVVEPRTGRYAVKLMLKETASGATEKDVLIKEENLEKATDDHYGFWGCPECGQGCNCKVPGEHKEECVDYQSTEKAFKFGSKCPGTARCVWIGCCLSDTLEGPCKALNRQTVTIPESYVYSVSFR